MKRMDAAAAGRRVGVPKAADGGADADGDDLEWPDLCAAFLNDDDAPLLPCFMDTREGLACSHTHTCNPPVNENDPSHTHTCVHLHTKTVGASASQPPPENAAGSKKPAPSGNRAAVRKYRERKKAEAASLEDEVARLRASTQRLLEENAALQAEKLAWQAEIGGAGVNNNHGGHGAWVVPGAGAAAQGTISSSCDFFRCNDYHCNPAGGASSSRGRQPLVVGHGACANIQYCTAGSSTPQPVSASHAHGGVDTAGPAGAGGLPNVDNK